MYSILSAFYSLVNSSWCITDGSGNPVFSEHNFIASKIIFTFGLYKFYSVKSYYPVIGYSCSITYLTSSSDGFAGSLILNINFIENEEKQKLYDKY